MPTITIAKAILPSPADFEIASYVLTEFRVQLDAISKRVEEAQGAEARAFDRENAAELLLFAVDTADQADELARETRELRDAALELYRNTAGPDDWHWIASWHEEQARRSPRAGRTETDA